MLLDGQVNNLIDVMATLTSSGCSTNLTPLEEENYNTVITSNWYKTSI